MGRSYFSNQETSIEKEGLTVDSIKKAIKLLTDEDFNGNNGEDYYTEIEVDGRKISMSRLDAKWIKATAGKSDEEILNNACYIIEQIVASNYIEDDGYYEDSFVKAIETEKSIECFAVYSYYN